MRVRTLASDIALLTSKPSLFTTGDTTALQKVAINAGLFMPLSRMEKLTKEIIREQKAWHALSVAEYSKLSSQLLQGKIHVSASEMASAKLLGLGGGLAAAAAGRQWRRRRRRRRGRERGCWRIGSSACRGGGGGGCGCGCGPRVACCSAASQGADVRYGAEKRGAQAQEGFRWTRVFAEERERSAGPPRGEESEGGRGAGGRGAGAVGRGAGAVDVCCGLEPLSRPVGPLAWSVSFGSESPSV